MIAAEIKMVIVDKASKLMTLLERRDSTPGLRWIACMEQWDASLTQMALDVGITLISFSELEVRAKELPQRLRCSETHPGFVWLIARRGTPNTHFLYAHSVDHHTRPAFCVDDVCSVMHPKLSDALCLILKSFGLVVLQNTGKIHPHEPEVRIFNVWSLEK